MEELSSARLRLIALTPDLLALFAASADAVDRELGLKPAALTVPPSLLDDYGQALSIWADAAAAPTADFVWTTNWRVVLRDAQQAIGGIGFAGPPNPEGRVYLAYWLDERFQRKGYMSEAVAALTDWAFQSTAVRSVAASAPRENMASQRVLLKNGFARDGEYQGHPLFVRRRDTVIA